MRKVKIYLVIYTVIIDMKKVSYKVVRKQFSPKDMLTVKCCNTFL